MRITIPRDIESALNEQAQRRGQSPEAVALDALRERFVQTNGEEEVSGSLADYLADHIGVLSSSGIAPGGANMSEKCGEKFADGLEDKRKQGRL